MRRTLISRAERDGVPTSPARESATPRSRQSTVARANNPAGEDATALPPYEAPECPLSVDAQRKLSELLTGADKAKYQRHVVDCVAAVTDSAAECNDTLQTKRKMVRNMAEKRRLRQQEDGDHVDTNQDEAYLEAESSMKRLERKVDDVTTKAEKALRDLIDYRAELDEKQAILTEVSQNIAVRAVAQAARDERQGIEDSYVEERTLGADSLSPVELLQQENVKYAEAYAAKSMRARYADHNDYRHFKRTIHDALHPEEDAPPVPHPSTWFPDDVPTPNARTRGTRAAEDDDDEVVIARATTVLKCPLTLQYFKEPYSNKICKHSFEKAGILEYHDMNGVVFGAGPGRRGNATSAGRKQVECPQTGCEAMLGLDDFFLDQLLLRQVKRAQKAMAEEEEDDEDVSYGDVGITGTSPSKNRKVQLKHERLSRAPESPSRGQGQGRLQAQARAPSESDRYEDEDGDTNMDDE